MLSVDRRLRSSERPLRRIVLVWCALVVILVALCWRRVMDSQFPDPDDVLRLVQIRNLLGGQGWFDLVQHRIDPPEGTAMHWSRLLDLPLAALVMALTPLLGPGHAETIAIVAMPMLTLGAILLCVGMLAWRLFDTRIAGLACLTIGLLGPLVFQLQPMRIDHHGWQAFCVALSMLSMIDRMAARGGAVAGLAMAAGVSISVELLPFAAAFGGIFALRWLRDQQNKWWLVAYMLTLASGMAGLFLATRGMADLAQHCDQISPAHIGFFAITAIAIALIAAIRSMPSLALIAAWCAAGAAGVLYFGLASPGCLMTPFAALDPLVREFWYLNVLEGRPLWEQHLPSALPSVAQLVLAFAVSVHLYRRSHDWLRLWWMDYAALLGASIVLSLFVWRSAALASVLAAIPLGYCAARLLDRMEHSRHLGIKFATALATTVILLPAAPVALVQAMLPKHLVKTIKPMREANCDINNQAARLDRLRPGTVFAPLDIGPAILLRSHHSVVATGHHRAHDAIRDVIRAFVGSESEAHMLVTAHGADYLAMCTDLAEPGLYASSGDNGFAARLMSGERFDWLEPVALTGPAELRVWRVKPQLAPVSPE